MDHPKTVKVKPWGQNQGEYVIMNESDFDPARHVMYNPGETRVIQDPMKPTNPEATTRKKKRRKKKTG